MSMSKRFLPLATLSAIVLLTGCSHLPFIGKRFKNSPPPKPKESPYIATDAQKEFQQRWMTKRVNDLLSQGLAPEAARAQAEAEFNRIFSATEVAGH